MFDQRIGDVFCARVAGNIVNMEIIGSLEYLHQGRGRQGDRRAGAQFLRRDQERGRDVKLGNITALLKNFQPALATLTKADGHRDSTMIRWYRKSPRPTPA